MTKQEFLDTLGKYLSGFPEEERAERLSFYSEMIDDRIEAGISEIDAVAALGTPKAVSEQILKETPLFKLAKEKAKPKRPFTLWEILLLALGSPVWLSLAVAAVSVLISLYAVLWSALISLWACFVAFGGASIGGTVGGTVLLLTANAPAGLALIGSAIFAAGLSVFFFFGCKAATVGTVILSNGCILWIKRLFLKKEEA